MGRSWSEWQEHTSSYSSSGSRTRAWSLSTKHSNHVSHCAHISHDVSATVWENTYFCHLGRTDVWLLLNMPKGSCQHKMSDVPQTWIFFYSTQIMCGLGTKGHCILWGQIAVSKPADRKITFIRLAKSSWLNFWDRARSTTYRFLSVHECVCVGYIASKGFRLSIAIPKKVTFLQENNCRIHIHKAQVLGTHGITLELDYYLFCWLNEICWVEGI